MKHSLWISVLAVAAMAAFVTGCATTGAGLSDEEMVQLQVEKWGQGLVDQDIELFLSTVSEDFSARQAPDKATLADFINQAMQAGYLEEAEIILDDAQFTMGDGVCTVYPVDLMSIAGSVAVELTFTKEAGGWLVTGMDIDGL